jgi:tetratricopeptide (TPR) repeat protein
MKKILWIMLAAVLTACSDNKQKDAEAMLTKANTQFEQGQYDRALITIDSLRKVYPNAIETRKQALRLQQDIELKRSQEELALVDSALQAVKQDYEHRKLKVEKDKEALRATPEELTMLTKTRVRRDSLQTRFDVLCAKIRYIHKKQKEL